MKKLLAAILSVALLLSGCTAQGGASTSVSPSSSQAQPIVAMGRYVEKDFSPDFNYIGEVRRISMNISQDNKLTMHVYGGVCQTYFCNNGTWDTNGYSDDEMLKPVIQKYMTHDTLHFQSEDNATPHILERINTTSELVGPDGYCFTTGAYMYSETYSVGGGEVPGKNKNERFIASYNGTDARYYNIPEDVQTFMVDGVEENSYGTFGRISRQNAVILCQKDEIFFYDISKEGGEKLGAVTNEQGINSDSRSQAELVAIIDNCVLVANNSNANIYDLSTDKKVASVELDNIEKVCEGADGTFYAINKEGIWRILPQGGIVQRVVDGAGCSFAAPGFRILSLIQGDDGSFYVAGNSNEKAVVYKYEFTTNITLEREKTLHLWSLKDNPTIREAAAEFMRQNPEVMVYIEIAPTDTSAQKAIEKLKIALHAGTGPDLVVTDGIDLEYFAQQNLLADLTDKIDLSKYDKRLLPAGQINGKQIALGTKIFYTTATSRPQKQAPLQLEQLLDTLNASPSLAEIANSGNSQKIAAYQCTDFPQDYEMIYNVASAEIWKNGFNKSAAEITLQLLKTIKSKFMHQDDYSSDIQSEVYFQIANNRYSNTGVPVGLNGKANIMLKRMIAYSANTQNADLCIAFINTMLSDYVQKAYLDDSCEVTSVDSISYFDKEDSISLTGFALDFLITSYYSKPTKISDENIQFATENYPRDDGFKAIANDYIEGKIDLNTALAKAEKL